jgi:3-oxoacyl-[acyl-carrier protein] reductase
LELDGRIAFVTGSTRGIGWASACALARAGATVVLNGRSDEARLYARVAELKAMEAGDHWGVLCDVGDPAAVRGCYRSLFERFRRLDVLVNNAGILQDALLGMISDEVAATTFAVNALGPLYNLQEASRLMARHRSGSIINVASIIGVTGNTGQSAYGASKAAVIGLTRSAAKELAPKNVRVNAVAPGFIQTDMTSQLPKAKFDERVASIGMKRVGLPEDVAQVILFLASDRSAYVTGQVIGVDGGMLI